MNLKIIPLLLVFLTIFLVGSVSAVEWVKKQGYLVSIQRGIWSETI